MKKAVVYLWLASFLMSFAPILPQESNSPLWMRYPVISPDGSTIVFAYKGDLYKVAANGGVAAPLTISDSYEFMPVFSEDGQTLYFASDVHGNFDVYSVPMKGGTPKRLTFHSSNDFPQCLSADKKEILFTASRMDNAQMSQFPYGALGELYSVSIEGGREKQVLSIAMEEVKYNHAGTQLFFQDKKGYEDTWRKHHTSAVTRDLWSYTTSSKEFKQLTTFNGEDRNPVWSANDSEMYYLSEKSGSFNVWKQNASGTGEATQITRFDKNPVRFLSIDKNNTLCFGFDGEIYTQKSGEEAKKVAITIETAERNSEYKTETTSGGASELKVSPNGKEIAFINHGEVYVVSMEGGVTKRITNTPEEERNLSFSPDGKQLIYASERNNKWCIYQTKLVRDTEKYFYSSTVLQEDPLIVDEHENFQAKFSPDGKEIAYIQDRTAVAVYNIASKKSRTVQAANKNYSYSDGDQSFDWSPDSHYLLVQFLQDGYWRAQVGLIDVTGKEPMFALTQNGFDNSGAYFNMDGNAVLFYSNKNGMKNVASHGAQYDIYGLFLNQDAYDQFKMKKVDYELWKEKKAEDDASTSSATTDKDKEEKKNKNKKDDKKKEEPAKPLKIEKEGLELRKARLTENSSFLGDGFLNKEGTKLYYYTSYGDGTDLWVRDFKEQETKVLVKLNAGWAGSSDVDKDIKNVFSIIDGKIVKIDLEKGERKDIAYNAEITRDGAKERAYLFEHIWRQTKEKFYVTNMQGVDWDYYKTVYAKFLPYINNNKDFAEMCSEMLGELNASHTGCFYRPENQNPDETAQLGAFFDETYTGDGLKIQEVIEKGPLVSSTSKIKAGVVIEKIDNQDITANTNYYQLLNRKAGKYTSLSLYDPSTKQRWEETVKPVQPGVMSELLYQRWVKRMQVMTDKLSNGELGYMHVRGMDDGSYREFYDQVMGKYVNKKALVVDTRFNGGGWLHDDLATFLSGKQYINFVPRENKIGIEPGGKWTKPSVVLMSEGNYSDAHMFPMVYKTLGIGKLVGMPVPGTGTAVWWENMLDHTLVFGIPQVGVMTMDGKYYENNQCEPDIKIANDYPTMLKGEDAQLKKAVESLLGM